jgi:hypothetical protein
VVCCSGHEAERLIIAFLYVHPTRWSIDRYLSTWTMHSQRSQICLDTGGGGFSVKSAAVWSPSQCVNWVSVECKALQTIFRSTHVRIHPAKQCLVLVHSDQSYAFESGPGKEDENVKRVKSYPPKDGNFPAADRLNTPPSTENVEILALREVACDSRQMYHLRLY